jgi:hypothetical protein
VGVEVRLASVLLDRSPPVPLAITMRRPPSVAVSEPELDDAFGADVLLGNLREVRE